MGKYIGQVGRHNIVSKNPSQYPVAVGDQYVGEVEGYIYDPWGNRYIADQKAQDDYLIATGQKEKQPEPIGVMEQAAIAGGVGLASEGVKYGANTLVEPGGLLGKPIVDAGVTATNVATSAATPAAEATGLLTPTATATTTGTTAAAPAAPFMGVGLLPATAIAGGIALGAKGVRDLVSGKNDKSIAGIGGRATLGIATGGISEVLRAVGVFDKPKTEVEDKRQKDLVAKLEQSGFDPNNVLPTFKGTSATAKEQVKKNVETYGVDENFQGWKNGQYINNKALKSGNENDLTGLDVQGYAKITERLLDRNEISAQMTPLEILKAKMDLSDRAVAAGAVKASKGTIDIDETKLDKFNNENADFVPESWDKFKYETSKQSVKEGFQGNNWRQEIARRKELEPTWTDWNKIEQELAAAEEATK